MDIDNFDYLHLLEERRNQIAREFDRHIDDDVWHLFSTRILSGDFIPTDTDPKVVVDNLAINGDILRRKDFTREDPIWGDEFEECEGDWDMFVLNYCLMGDDEVAIIQY